MRAALRCPRIVFLLVLPTAVLLQGCGSPVSTTGPSDCRGLSGEYWDVGQPGGNSLTGFLLGKKPPEGRSVQLQVDTGSLHASSGALAGTLAVVADFNCSAVDRIVLTRQESSRIHLPPLIDKVRIVTFMLTGGPGMDLILTRQAQTSAAAYGAKFKGPVQEESITTWRRTRP